MSKESQQKNMKAIHSLVSKDLGYIFGESKSGPNGPKKEFLSKSATFLRALAKDLGFKEYKVNTNPGGIAVSGDVSLYGMWGDGDGICFYLNQPLYHSDGFMYRRIKHMKDYGGSGGRNQWLSCSLFADGSYDRLVEILISLRNGAADFKPKDAERAA